MPLMEHFAELRVRIFKSALFISLFAVFGWTIYDKLIQKLALPVCDLQHDLRGRNCGILYINGVLGPIDLKFKISLIFGLLLASPFWLFQLWRFFSPALRKKEKKSSLIFIIFSIPFFMGGSYIGYRIMPIAIKLLLGFTPNHVSNLIRFDDYLIFVAQLIVVFGIAFELPVILLGFNAIGVLSGRTILKPWRFAIFGIMLFAAVFTPTGDPFTMLILAVPLIFLYLLSGAISLLRDKRKKTNKR